MKLTSLKGFSVLGFVEIHQLDIVFPKWLQKYPLSPMLFHEEDFYVHIKRQSIGLCSVLGAGTVKSTRMQGR